MIKTTSRRAGDFQQPPHTSKRRDAESLQQWSGDDLRLRMLTNYSIISKDILNNPLYISVWQFSCRLKKGERAEDVRLGGYSRVFNGKPPGTGMLYPRSFPFTASQSSLNDVPANFIKRYTLSFRSYTQYDTVLLKLMPLRVVGLITSVER